MTDRELMQQALEALERYGGVDQRACDAEEALRERLAQPEQKPMAVPVAFITNGGKGELWWSRSVDENGNDNIKDIPLYTTPPQRKPLTHPQIHEFDWPDGVSFEDILPFVRAIEAAHGIKGNK